jgi:hypothetical protein
MKMWRVAFGVIALVIASQAAFADDDEVGERFIAEYKKNYPSEKWELIGTVKMNQAGTAGTVGRSKGTETIRVYFKRAGENTLRTAACNKTREKDWVCEVGQNLPEGSLVLR